MKALRIFGLTVIVLVALLATAAIALLLLVDPNQFKGEIARVVKESKQRTLTIQGDLKLTLFPHLGIDLGKTSLSAHNSDEPFASVESAKVSVALLPLLKKQLLIDHVQISGVNATIKRNQDGKTNIDDLLKKSDAQSNTVQFDIAGFELSNSTLQLDDAITHTVATLDQINIRTGRIADGVPTTLEVNTGFNAKHNETQSMAQAKLQIKTELLFKLDAGEFSFNNMEIKLDGALASLHDVALTLYATSLSLSPARISADNLKLRAQGKQAENTFNAQFNIPKLNLSPAAASSSGLSGELTINSDKNEGKNLSLKFDASSLSGTAKTFNIDKLRLTADGRQSGQLLKARIDTPLTGSLDLHTLDMSAISADVTLSGPTNTTTHFNGSVQTDLNKQSIAAELDGRIDGSKIEAKLGITNFSQPDINFDVVLDQINFDRYIKPAAKGSAAASGTTAPAESEKPIDLSAFANLKAQGKLRIYSLQIQNIRAQSVLLGMHAGDGHIEISPFDAELYYGRMNGSASVTASAHPQLTLKQSLNGVSINPLMKDAFNRDVLEGYGDVNLDIHTTGNTVSQLKSGLDGSMALRMRDGAIKGFNLAKSLREFKSQLDVLQGKTPDQTKSINTSEKTDFSELSISFNLRNGVAHSDDLNMKSPFFRIGGSGNFDLVRQQIDYIAKATVVNTSGGQGGKELAQLTDLTIPVRLSGPFHQPTYSIEWSGVASKAVENKLKSKLTEKLFGKSGDNNSSDSSGTNSSPSKTPQDQLKDKLRDGLKGLLSR